MEEGSGGREGGGGVQKTWRGGGGPEDLEKTSDDELQKMPHTKAPKFKPPPRLKPTL